MADDNIALGINSLGASTTGTGNVVIGTNAGSAYTSIGSDNILIGAGSDIPSSGTSDYLNIGGAITGSTASGGYIYISNPPPLGDISNKIATTAFVKSVGGVLKILGSGTIDTSSMTNNLIDFSSYGLNVPNDTYSKLVLELRNIVSSNATILYAQFVNQTTANSGSNYGTGALGAFGGPGVTLSNPYNAGPVGNAICCTGGIVKTDGSVSIELRGFCFGVAGTPNVMPNITVRGMCYTLGTDAASCYFDSVLQNIACNNLANKVFDGLVFIDSVGGTSKHTFSWELYGQSF